MSDWCISEFVVTEEDARISAMRSAFSFSSRGRCVPAGSYRRLTRDGKTIMSDTPDELRDLAEFKEHCSGSVLINGLGLGCAVEIALGNHLTTSIEVVEVDQKVIDLVAPGLRDPRLVIYCADSLTWKHPDKGTRWNVVWHDIWDDICSDNLGEMSRLHRRYGGRCDWQGSWCRERW